MFIKKHKKFFTLSIIVVLLSIAGLLGFNIARNEPRIVEISKTPESSSVLPAGADNAKIDRNATVKWDYEYKKCAHHIFVSCQIDEDMAGLTFSMLQEQYPDIKIIDFEPDKLVLKKSFDCYCPEHMILKKCEDELAIFRTALGTDKQDIYLKISIKFDDLGSDERQVLSTGKVFNNLEELEGYLENIET